MSNGKDKPGEYRVTPIPGTADALKAFAESQEADGFLVVAMNQDYIVFYKH